MMSSRQPTADRAARQTVACAVAGVVIIVLSAVLLAGSMAKEVSRDEHMYCAAGVLVGRGMAIYRDFAYPAQLPYHPLLLAGLYRSLGTTHYLLVGRLVSVVCDVLVLLLILGIYRTSFGPYRSEGLFFGLAAVVLYVFNPLVGYAAGYAWNHDVVVLCVMLSLWLFIRTDVQHRSCSWRMAVMGALLTVATCMRVTTALVVPLFLGVPLLITRRPLRDRMWTVLPFVAACLIALVWPIWLIAQAPRAFWLNLVRIPALYGSWLHERGIVFDKAALTVAALRTPGYLVLLILAGYLLLAIWRGGRSVDVQHGQKALLAAMLPVVFFIIAYIPPTMWQQYLAVPVPFIVAALAYPLAGLRQRAGQSGPKVRYRLACGLTGVAVIVAVVSDPGGPYRSLLVLVPERWAPVELHRMSRDIVAPIDTPGLVLTLGPLYALEGGGDIYPQLACGSIIYRAADRMSPQQRQVTHTVGPETLGDMVSAPPPSAVIVGVEPPYFAFLEAPFRRLVPPDWPKETYGETLQVYRRP